MVNQLIQANEIEGIQPALEPRKITKPFVMAGRNFLIDVDGPYSGFGSRFPTYEKVAPQTNAETVRVGEQVFLFTSKAIFTYNTVAQVFEPIFVFDTEIITLGAWSVAFVGNRYYFVHVDLDLLEWVPSTNTWTLITDNVPAGLVSGCESNGRLVLLGAEYIAWSALGVGDDLLPSLTTGAGNQHISIIGGTTLAVRSYGGGFLTYTSQGILKSEFSTGVSPFRHLPLTRDIQPLNAFCVLPIDINTHIILDRKGFFSTDGGKPQPWQPLMSEYLSHRLFPQYERRLRDKFVFRLTYSNPRKLVILSFADPSSPSIYLYAYFYYMPVEKWGIFNERHLFFGEINISEGALEGFNFGYVDEFGFTHSFLTLPYNEQAPDFGLYDYYHSGYESAARYVGDTLVVTSTMFMSSTNFEPFTGVGSGLYQLISSEWFEDEQDAMPTLPEVVTVEVEDYNLGSGSEDWNSDSGEEDWGGEPYYYLFTMQSGAYHGVRYLLPSVYSPTYGGLNSFIQIGLFRFTEAKYPDEMQLLTELTVGMDGVGGETIIEDWNSAEFNHTEDWNSLDDVEDYGENLTDNRMYDIEVWGTLDGTASVFADNEVVPYLYDRAGAMDFYQLQITGLYTILKISALETGQSYHLKSLELSGTLAGRL